MNLSTIRHKLKKLRRLNNFAEKSKHKKLPALVKSVIATIAFSMVFNPIPAIATPSNGYDFNTNGDLASYFDSYVSTGAFQQVLSGGISGSGAISAPSSNAYAVFPQKSNTAWALLEVLTLFRHFLKMKAAMDTAAWVSVQIHQLEQVL